MTPRAKIILIAIAILILCAWLNAGLPTETELTKLPN